VRRLEGAVVAGLARGVATQPELAGFLSHRPELLERIANADAQTLDQRASELAASALDEPAGDLETALDALRLLRREETAIAVCCDLGGLAAFGSSRSSRSSPRRSRRAPCDWRGAARACRSRLLR
jgi:glutamine synthetase adenylyltransferase